MVSIGSTLRGNVRRAGRLRLRSSWRDDFAHPAALPQLQRYWNRINVETLPPSGFVSGAMQLAVMKPADWDDELVAHASSESPRLGKREVMRVRRHTAAHEAGLPQHESSVVLIAQANRFAQSLD